MVRTALVTGATGFIGSNLVRRLTQMNWKVYVLLRRNSSLGNWRLKDIQNIEILYMEDIYDDKGIKETISKELPQFDICFNLASYGVDYRQQQISEIVNGNINFTLSVIKFCALNNTRLFVHTGSCFEYGNHGTKIMTEDDMLFPQSLYGAAKASSVLMANAYAASLGIPLVTVRPFGIYGEYEGMHKLVPQLIEAIIKDIPLELTPGEQIRDYLYIDDLINALLLLAENLLKDSEQLNNKNFGFYDTYNICSSRKVSIKDVIEILCEITGCSSRLFLLGNKPYRNNEVMSFTGSNLKLKQKTDWDETYTLEQGLKRTFDWYKKYLEE